MESSSKKPDITERPEPPLTLRDRARASAEEFQRITVTISSGALAVFFIALTQKVDPPLTSLERGWVLVAIAGMALATLCAIVTWFADAHWNAALAIAKETPDLNLRESMKGTTRFWRRVEITAGYVFACSFFPGLLAVGVYTWLRAK